MDQNQSEIIDLRLLFRKILQYKKTFAIVLPIVFVLSSLLIVCVPRTYTSDIKLAPEIETSATGGSTLSSLASTFGVDLSGIQSSDAISPMLYPDLMEDNGFVAGLFPIKIKTADGAISTTYYDYLKKYKKYPWWESAFAWLKQFLPQPAENLAVSQNKQGFNAYYVSKRDNDLMNSIRHDITIDVDKKYGVITIKVSSQDPLVCKIMADSVKDHLQVFITQYRTNKARLDEAYYHKLMNEAKQTYTRTRQAYGRFADANEDVILQSYKAKQEDLENEMQLQYNTYSMLNTQWKAARARIQDATPAFTILKGASVPIKPTGPKRMLFVIFMLVVASFFIVGHIVKKEILKKSPLQGTRSEP